MDNKTGLDNWPGFYKGTDMDNKIIAKVCHEVNRAYCQAIGDEPQAPWEEAPDWQHETCINGVGFHLDSGKTPEESHQAWLDEKTAAGWVYGKEKDAEKKTHPCMVPYEELPLEQKVKDFLFAAVVKTLSSIPDPAPVKSEQQVVVEPGKLPVRYVGHRPEYTDGAYETGICWQRGETKMVPEDKANLMLRHPDVYELGEAEGAAVPEVNKATEEDDTEEDYARDSIRQMNRKATLIDFAKTNFNVELDTGSRVKVADLQAECIRLVDQFGMPG